MGAWCDCSLITYYHKELVIFAFGQSRLMSPARVGVEPIQVGITQQIGKRMRPC